MNGPVDATSPDQDEGLRILLAGLEAGRSVIIGDPSAPPIDLSLVPGGGHLVTVTSGSTGRPRPIVRTVASWTDSFAPFTSLVGLTSADRVGLTGPLSSSMQSFAAVHAHWVGATIAPLGTATVIHCVPTFLSSLLDGLSRAPNLRTVVVAGAGLPVSLADKAKRQGLQVVEYYGAAELSLVAASAGGALLPFAGVEVEVRDDVLWARSPYLAKGYLAGTSGPLTWDAAGFGSVGDRAMIGANGTVKVLGRADAAINVGGATIQAEDVEAVLGELPGVIEVAIVGASHETLGQVIAAVVVLSKDADLAEVRAEAKAVLSGPALPRRWRQVEALPRTGAGKLARDRVAWR